MQLKTSYSIKFFHEMFKNKFGFEDYKSISKPTIFFGIYGNKDLVSLANHNGVSIVWLAGSDSMIIDNLKEIKRIQQEKDIVVVAESKWIEHDLDNVGIRYINISLFMDDIWKWNPVHHGKSLFWYNANTTKYGKQYLPIIRREFPELDIITNDAHTVPREQMPEIYAKCFAGFRPVEHDGVSQSSAEMGLMGRYIIYNGSGPHCLHWNNIDDVIRIIKNLQQGYNYKLISKRTREFFKSGEKQWCDLILDLYGTNELDVCGIFSPSSKRPGSIFRIMRSDVVRKMPNLFGTDQFERPYVVEQLNKLGLKQLITNKNSGFVAGEFKGIGNKGYEEGFKEFHTYDPRY